jgi:hypothetical protein
MLRNAARIAAFGFLFAVPARATTPSAPPKSMVLERFDGPWAWTAPTKRDGKQDYAIVAEAGNSFLRGDYIPGTKGHVIYREIKWNSKEMPWLRWRWRVNRFPEGAKISDDGKSDSSAQVYVSWKLGGRSYALKYFWSLTDPVGTSFHRGKWNPLGRYFGQIIRMGGATGEWNTETRNVVEEFRRAFGKDPPDEAVGIGVLTDGDATKTQPQADYDDFEAFSTP